MARSSLRILWKTIWLMFCFWREGDTGSSSPWLFLHTSRLDLSTKKRGRARIRSREPQVYLDWSIRTSEDCDAAVTATIARLCEIFSVFHPSRLNFCSFLLLHEPDLKYWPGSRGYYTPLPEGFTYLFITIILTSHSTMSNISVSKIHPIVISDHAPVSFIWSSPVNINTSPLDSASTHPFS